MSEVRPVNFIWIGPTVLLNYRYADFEHGKKPKGVPLEIENFFVEGVNERVGGESGAF